MHKLATTDIRLAPALELKRAPESGALVGYASVFDGQPDAYGDLVRKGAFAASIAEHRAAKTLPSFLWSHRPDMPIGQLTEMREDDVGLWIEAHINRKTSAGKDAYESLAAGDTTGLSIGYQTRARDGAVLTDVHVLEISAVTMPANARARVTSIKSRGDLELALAEIGLPKRAARKLAGGGWPALSDDDEVMRCNFCQKSRPEVRLIEWGDRHICHGCATACASVAEQNTVDWDAIARGMDAITRTLKG